MAGWCWSAAHMIVTTDGKAEYVKPLRTLRVEQTLGAPARPP
jgi:hypothetical protein